MGAFFSQTFLIVFGEPNIARIFNKLTKTTKISRFHYYDLGYTEAFIFDQFIINQMKEGEVITPQHGDVLNKLIKKHFGEKPMIYISNRIMSYAIDPLTYVSTSKIKNLLAIAIVTQNEKFKKNAEYEKTFFEKPFKIFRNLSNAITWANKIVIKN